MQIISSCLTLPLPWWVISHLLPCAASYCYWCASFAASSHLLLPVDVTQLPLTLIASSHSVHWFITYSPLTIPLIQCNSFATYSHSTLLSCYATYLLLYFHSTLSFNVTHLLLTLVWWHESLVATSSPTMLTHLLLSFIQLTNTQSLRRLWVQNRRMILSVYIFWWYYVHGILSPVTKDTQDLLSSLVDHGGNSIKSGLCHGCCNPEK